MKVHRLFAGVAITTLVTTMLAGCSAGANVALHPLEGPVAAANPGFVIKAVSTGLGNDGTLSFALPDGGACKGTWARTTNRVQQDPELLPDSGTVTRHGSVKSVSEAGVIDHGRNKGAHILGDGTCSNGATFEFASIANGFQGRGALRDSNGNIFKIVLR